MSASNVPDRNLPFIQRLSFAFGHVQNDLSSAMWFSYFLLYFHYVQNFENYLAGYLLLIGQVMDAVCTPFIGYELDRAEGISCLGKRKSCHLLGAFCVTLSFPFIFSECLGCSNRHALDLARFIYYAPIVVIFQFGWAATQISHLSLIPDLSSNESERVGLNGLRNAFAVLSNVIVFGVAWLIFGLHSDSGTTGTSFSNDEFQRLVFIIIGIGVVCNVVFHIGVREKRKIRVHDFLDARDENQSYNSERHYDKSLSEKVVMRWKDWLKCKEFYKGTVIYVCTRMFVIISQVYMPLYTLETLQMKEEYVAILPLVAFTSGIVTSLLMKTVNGLIGRKTTFLIGELCGIIACAWFYFIQINARNQVYGTCVLFGVSSATMMVTSLSMTSDLIADNAESGGFVYGAMSFADKLINGVTIALIQGLHPCKRHCPACSEYSRSIVSFVPGGAVIFGFIVFLTLRSKNVVHKPNSLKNNQEDTLRGSREEDPLLVTKYESIDNEPNGILTESIEVKETRMQ